MTKGVSTQKPLIRHKLFCATVHSVGAQVPGLQYVVYNYDMTKGVSTAKRP